MVEPLATIITAILVYIEKLARIQMIRCHFGSNLHSLPAASTL